MNVVFDLGAVLIDWNPRHLYRKVFADEARMEWFLAEVCHNEWNLEQDRGRSFDDAVAEATARHPALKNEIALYRDRWMEMIGGDIPETVEILEELYDKGIPLYAITNWNGDTFRTTREQFGFLSLFRDIVVSGDEKLIKPDRQIYDRLLLRNKLDPVDCLFIDDSLKNVKGAEAVGMQAHHFTSAGNLRADLAQRGLL